MVEEHSAKWPILGPHLARAVDIDAGPEPGNCPREAVRSHRQDRLRFAGIMGRQIEQNPFGVRRERFKRSQGLGLAFQPLGNRRCCRIIGRCQDFRKIDRLRLSHNDMRPLKRNASNVGKESLKVVAGLLVVSRADGRRRRNEADLIRRHIECVHHPAKQERELRRCRADVTVRFVNNDPAQLAF